MTTTLTEQPTKRGALALIERAIDGGFAADQLKVLFDLYNAEKANQAAEAYAEAMHRIQERLPVIVKKKDGQNGKYVQLEDIEAVVKPILASEGFSHSFSQSEGAPEGHIRMVVTLTHRLGHKESSWMDVALDNLTPHGKANAMTPPQRSGSTSTYAQRYVLCKSLALTIAGEDTDAAGRLHIEPSQIGQLNDLIVSKQVDLPKFLAWAFGVDLAKLNDDQHRLDLLPQREFARCLDMLQRRKAGAK